jgi:hypothetical protein
MAILFQFLLLKKPKKIYMISSSFLRKQESRYLKTEAADPPLFAGSADHTASLGAEAPFFCA